MIQSLKKRKIKFVFTHGKRHIASIDCSSFTINEFYQDPSGRWFDHKSNFSSLVRFRLLGTMILFCLFPSCLLPIKIFFIYHRNMKPAWISGREGLYHSENNLNQQHTTNQFFMEAKRKFQKKVGIEMHFI